MYLLMLDVFNLLQEVADEPEAQTRKVGEEWCRTADEWSGPARKTREEDEHFLHATGENISVVYNDP